MKSTLIIIILFLLIAGSGWADEISKTNQLIPDSSAGSPGLDIESVNEPTLKDLFQLAFDNNPQIQAARSEWLASVEKYPQARSLPDPVLNTSWFIEPIETRNGSNDFGIQLMQMIPNPQKIRLKGKRTLTMAEMAQVKFEKTVRDTLVDIMNSYYELGYLERSFEISETNVALFRQLVELGEKENSQGMLGSSELYAAESRLAQAVYEQNLLFELRESEKAKMRKLLGLTPDAAIGKIKLPEVEEIKIDLDSLRKLVNEHRLELELAGLSIDLAQIDLSMAKALNAPDFSIGFMYNSIGVSPMSDGMMTSGDDAYGVMFGVTLPIWGGKNKARVNEAKARLEASEANLKAQTDNATESADLIYWKLKNLERLAKLYDETLLPQAQNALNLAQTWYEEGSTPFSQLVETRLVAQNFELATVRAKSDYLKAIAELAKIAGIPVTNIAIEKKETETEEVER